MRLEAYHLMGYEDYAVLLPKLFRWNVLQQQDAKSRSIAVTYLESFGTYEQVTFRKG